MIDLLVLIVTVALVLGALGLFAYHLNRRRNR